MTILISEKIDFQSKTVTKDKKRVLLIKGSNYDKIITIYTAKNGTPKYLNQSLIEFKGETALQ